MFRTPYTIIFDFENPDWKVCSARQRSSACKQTAMCATTNPARRIWKVYLKNKPLHMERRLQMGFLSVQIWWLKISSARRKQTFQSGWKSSFRNVSLKYDWRRIQYQRPCLFSWFQTVQEIFIQMCKQQLQFQDSMNCYKHMERQVIFLHLSKQQRTFQLLYIK